MSENLVSELMAEIERLREDLELQRKIDLKIIAEKRTLIAENRDLKAALPGLMDVVRHCGHRLTNAEILAQLDRYLFSGASDATSEEQGKLVLENLPSVRNIREVYDHGIRSPCLSQRVGGDGRIVTCVKPLDHSGDHS